MGGKSSAVFGFPGTAGASAPGVTAAEPGKAPAGAASARAAAEAEGATLAAAPAEIEIAELEARQAVDRHVPDPHADQQEENEVGGQYRNRVTEAKRDPELHQALAGQNSRGDHRSEDHGHVEADKVIVSDAALELRAVHRGRGLAALRHARHLRDLSLARFSRICSRFWGCALTPLCPALPYLTLRSRRTSEVTYLATTAANRRAQSPILPGVRW